MANEITKTSDNIEDLLDKVSGLIEQARTYVKTSVNTAEVYTKYYIGKYIVEYEQEGMFVRNMESKSCKNCQRV